MKVKNYTTLLTLTILVGCSTENFNKKIETADFDLLANESFMRYNSSRLDIADSKNIDPITRAVAACHQKKFAKGQGILEEVMTENKNNPFYWNALGTCYSLSMDFSKSIFYYDLAKEAKLKDPDQNKLVEAMVENNVGLIHLHFKRYNEAYDSFKKANDLYPKYMTPNFNIAQLYLEFNENDKALAILKKLEEKNPNDIDLLYSISLIYFRKNDFDKSYQTMKRIKSDYLNRADIVGLYAYNLMKKNQLDEAKNIIERRMRADEFNQRNKIIEEEINQKISDNLKTTK